MKQLRRAGVCQDDLLYYYQAVVRPVLEQAYASPCWQRSLKKEQAKQLDVQLHALQIIFGNIPYDEARRTYNILSLDERRHELGKRFFPDNY